MNKIFNYIRNLKSIYLFNKNHHPDFPRYLQIENINVCNAECTYCPHIKMTRKKEVMDYKLFKKIIDEATKYKPIIVLQGWGEPFLDKLIMDRIKYIKSKGLKIIIYTNSSRFDDLSIYNMIKLKVDELRISMDTTNPEIFNKIKLNLNFNRVKANIERINYYKKNEKSKYPLIRIAYHNLSKDNVSFQEFYKYWKNFADDIKESDIHDWINRTSVYAANDNEGRMPCLILWTTMTILSNGDTALCCADYDGTVTMGKVRNKNIYDIWNSKQFNDLRWNHLNNNYNINVLCSKCTLWKFSKGFQPFWWKNYLLKNRIKLKTSINHE